MENSISINDQINILEEQIVALRIKEMDDLLHQDVMCAVKEKVKELRAEIAKSHQFDEPLTIEKTTIEKDTILSEKCSKFVSHCFYDKTALVFTMVPDYNEEKADCAFYIPGNNNVDLAQKGYFQINCPAYEARLYSKHFSKNLLHKTNIDIVVDQFLHYTGNKNSVGDIFGEEDKSRIISLHTTKCFDSPITPCEDIECNHISGENPLKIILDKMKDLSVEDRNNIAMSFAARVVYKPSAIND